MPTLKRFKTKYPGVYYVKGTSVSGKRERIFYIRYRKNGKMIEEKAGRQYQDDMTAPRAAQVRTNRIEGSQLPNRKRREREKALKDAEEGRWTIERLWNSYLQNRTPGKSLTTDECRYNKFIEPNFGSKEPSEILPLDADRVRIRLQKSLAPQTVKHVLNLLTWIVNYGVKKNLCQGLQFHLQKPTVNNIKTEDLNADQLRALLDAIESDPNIQVGNLMKMALFTGMRRGELFKLKWSDIDFDRGFILIRDPKGGPDQKIPMNDSARAILVAHPRRNDSAYVFPGQDGKHRKTVQAGVNKIKKTAGLPKDFRPLHGLRHAYASMLASSGEVDMYTLQKLLTHKSPIMTQRYAHLRDETLRKASNLADAIINEIHTQKPADASGEKK